jgi:hypothetical protein
MLDIAFGLILVEIFVFEILKPEFAMGITAKF